MTTLASPAIHTRPMAPFQSLVSNDEAPSQAPAPESPRAQPSALNLALGDHCNGAALADKLQGILQALPRQLVAKQSTSMAQARAQMEAALTAHLKSTTMYVCEDASYRPLQPLPPNRLVSLEAFILGSGLPLPKTLKALADLTEEMTRQAQVHPLGNFSGGLSWALPMPAQDQQRILALMQSNTSGLPDLPLADDTKGALGYLLSGSTVLESDLKKPVVAMEKLLGSSKAQALGLAIQTRLGGAATDGNADDYVMTAIHLGLDPQPLAAPTGTSVAGFDLAHRRHWGQPASAVIADLAAHLIEQGRASTQTAYLGAYLLLARVAPHYLVKDIPPSVTNASVLWAQLAIAVARIEAQTPGRTLAMGYAEILLVAEALDNDAASQQTAQQALRAWGVANGFLASTQSQPSDDEMERVRLAYNNQLNALKNASTLLQTPIPSRETMALAELEAAFPELDTKLFKVRHLQKASLKKGRPGVYPGMRSMLDIVMEGDSLRNQQHWITQDARIPIGKFCALYEAGTLGVAGSFKTAYDAAIHAHEVGHQTAVHNLICTLPLDDRENLELGKLEFFQTHQYKISTDLLTPPTLRTRGHTLEVKATRNGQVNVYTIDTRRGVIEKHNSLIRRRTEPYTASKLETREANILSRTALLEPDDAGQFQARAEGTAAPDSFNSRRSHAIADAFVKALDLKNADLLNEARGITSYDQDSARDEAVAEFFLNLIPLRSAIVNFQNGHIGQGLFDLALDAVGLVTLGAGKAAQAGKVLGKAVSSVGQAAKAARFVGASVIEAFNPLAGVGDLLLGGGRYAVAKVVGRFRPPPLSSVPDGELSNALFRQFNVPESNIAGLSPNSQGVYVAADGGLSHIRHTDSTGHTAVYEVRQVTRTAEGKIQARVYHNNRQTSLLVEQVEANRWQRLGLLGGQPPSIKADLGPVIGQGGEGIVYASRDGKRAYKDFGPTSQAPDEITELSEVEYLNKYYGDGFAHTAVDDGRLYLVMGRIDGTDLGHIKKGDLPPEARSLLADVFEQMEAKNIYHNDMQLKNYMYSATDKKVYPVDLDAMQAEWMPPFLMEMYQRNKQTVLNEYAALFAAAP
ncbi:hypothetical protein [Pseudomonas sp. S09G 359]|uniref:OspG family effector kinase n=1 Tax=Pseudomonas sp. S09G 359 TaxID=2054919 RepID=UPI0012FEC10D|nr:hypothetical protein [Pseudomonas sp. S09G 359]